MSVPSLRFKEFAQDSIEKKALMECTTRIGDGIHSTPNYDDEGSYHFVNGNNLVDDHIVINDSTKRVAKEEAEKHSRDLSDRTILLSINGTIGNTAFYRGERIMLGKSAAYINVSEGVSKDFVYQSLKSHRVQSFFFGELTGSTIKNLSLKTIRETKLLLPSLPEQRKIADFLSAVDEKIRLLTEKKDKLETYKKGVMQKLFPKQGQTNPELRFKRPDGTAFPDWEEKRLGVVFERITSKNKEDNQNVLTISAQHGLISQLEFFNKSVSASDLTGYYILERGDFAYNKSYSNGYPLGAIKRLDRYDKGVVSTLYICFRLIEDTGLNYWEHYFDAGQLNHEISKIAQEGARNHGLLNMSVVDFFKDIVVKIPSKEEMKRISKFLDELKTKVCLAETELDQMKDFKKGLLQQMFV
ncbi:restriction endonuclease subunit S [uncultured Roseivirga sp.]|uniref:restriction endonuclease subunit S n=1 Tax=uncultured Roseivirga sp. TaxID=543088 RepID=UPI000D795C4D|nr:restriction endonuclease subunit S [uncultured Roseivirga sp.]PWL28388.1 MAG: restriction endonuclease subunit S [Roseivirga sp. XM-24bin3]